jgi:hypothetical protein
VEICHGPIQASRHAAQVRRDRPRRAAAPGTFEHALHHLLEQAIDLTPFDARYRNDVTGAPAYAPAMLLRIVLFAYSRGIIGIGISIGAGRLSVEYTTRPPTA